MDHDYTGHAAGLESPAAKAFAITPSDVADLAQPTRALNVSGSGYVRVTTITGSEAVIFVAAGGAFPIRLRRVWATGTDAVGLVGLS